MTNNAIHVLLLLAYAVALNYIYLEWFVVSYSKQGYVIRSVGLDRWIGFVVSAMIIFTLLPKRRVERISDYMCWTLFVLLIFPALLFAVYKIPDSYGFVAFCASLICSVAILQSVPRLVRFKQPKSYIDIRKVARAVNFLVVLLLVYFFVKYQSLINLRGYQSIYEQRVLASEHGLAFPDGYLLNWLMIVFAPFVFAYALQFRRWFFVVPPILAVVLVYGINGYKLGIASLVMSLSPT